MRALGIDMISVMGMPPVQFIELAAELGCAHISIGLNQPEYNPYNFPRYSLRDDAKLRKEVKSALKANDIYIALGENLPIVADTTPYTLWADTLEILCDLGVRQVNSVSFEPNNQRNIEEYGKLSEFTASFGVKTLIEFVPIFGVRDMKAGLDIIEQVNSSNLGLIFDTMHAGRTGVTACDVQAVPPKHIGYIQICDVPKMERIPKFMDQEYMDEARYQRFSPGTGALPIGDYLANLPETVPLSLEVPHRLAAESGITLQETLRECVAATQDFLKVIK